VPSPWVPQPLWLHLLRFHDFVAAIFDTVSSAFFGDFVLAALRGEYGELVQSVVAALPSVMYKVLYRLGGLCNAIVARERKNT
jgi:hypothetical protein